MSRFVTPHLMPRSRSAERSMSTSLAMMSICGELVSSCFAIASAASSLYVRSEMMSEFVRSSTSTLPRGVSTLCTRGADLVRLRVARP